MDSFRRFLPRSGSEKYDRWKVILLCILAATTFWFFSALNKTDYTTTINLPIELSYPGEDTLLVVGELPKNVRVNVTGGGWGLFRRSFGIGIEPLEVEVPKPLESRHILGFRLIPVINDQVSSFTLNSVITDTLHFQIEKRHQRSIALKLEGIIPAPQHMLIGDLVVDPDTIIVSGPFTFIDDLKNTLVLNPSKTEISGQYQERIDIELGNNHLISSPSEVSVSFTVEELIDGQVNGQVIKQNFPSGYTLEGLLAEYLVNYQVPKSYVDSIQDNSIQVYADFDGLKQDSMVELQVVSSHPYIINLSMDTVLLPLTEENSN